MNHASAVPGNDKAGTNLTADYFRTPVSDKTPKKQPVEKQPEGAAGEPEASVAATATPEAAAEQLAREADRMVAAAEAMVERGESADGMLSAIEKLRRSSAALTQFTSDLRRQYHYEEEAEAFASVMADSGAATAERHQTEAVAEPVAPAKRQRVEGSLPGRGLLETASLFVKQTLRQPEVFTQHYTNFAKELFTILQARSQLEPERSDKRFRDAVWKDNVFYRVAMQTYLAWDKEVSGWVDDLELNDADRRRCQFIQEQLSALLAPTNSPLNPVAVKRAYQTGGKSVLHGVTNLLDDLRHNHGMPSQIRSDAFQVGVDLATSEGAVVYRSEVLELLQYRMDEGQVVAKRPVLIVPPQLNKFYIFDLSPKNSIVRHLKSSGVQPFVISWRNPSRHNGGWNLDKYVSELENAIEVMRELTGADKINLTSACAGGLTSMALLGYLQAANKPLVHSHSLFVTALQADESFSMALFATREVAELSRRMSEKIGYMDGKALSHIFNWLRPTDLVWNYWVNNYLLGKEPPSMDVLYWDNDSTRLPAGLHSDFLDIFIQDAFSKPGTLTVKGYPIDIKQLTMDFYCVGGDEDYLMPWKKCFEVPELVQSKCTFVLSTSGHIQSILRPPGIGNTFYYVNDADERDPDKWLAGASKESGSWWEHWTGWLEERGGHKCVASGGVGSKANPPLSPAPGLYVNEIVN
ncbi:alpha/beta hydrolase [Pseudomaricurvus sp. HS19]|uniref:PHA/PHB synthase family protein n=1 Tax=Pseudomaricurvus sp. HS19 TaxID=2692626 RepID=UPI00136AE0F7|nr:alpha/beta fold hydrolase [Pseudomaricurvus sp. HS19]MYM63627.1 class II poly(R)-hydroxyalkanoic acid synthase [Pseudomaricurvus sp. HS19]